MSSFAEDQATLSADGRWLAYVSDESGAKQVVVQTFPDASMGKWQISSARGAQPRWRHDGRELYYVDGQNQVIAVSVRTGGRFEVGDQTPLFESPSGARSFDVTPNGDRFVFAVQRSSLTNTESLTVAVNWMAELKKP